MMQSQVFRLRVAYRKGGRLAMLSHLELTHAIERTVRRSGLPFALSQGFSPHMKLAFGSALPVGIGGDREIFDLTLERYVAPAKALDALARSCPSDMMCLTCEYVEPKAPAASVAFPYSVYEAAYDGPVAAFEVPEQVEVVRKKKAKTMNVADFLVGEPAIDGAQVRFQLRSGQDGSLRPDVLLDNAAVRPAGSGLRDGDDRDPVLQKVTRIFQAADPVEDIAVMPA